MKDFHTGMGKLCISVRLKLILKLNFLKNTFPKMFHQCLRGRFLVCRKSFENIICGWTLGIGKDRDRSCKRWNDVWFRPKLKPTLMEKRRFPFFHQVLFNRVLLQSFSNVEYSISFFETEASESETEKKRILCALSHFSNAIYCQNNCLVFYGQRISRYVTSTVPDKTKLKG